MNLGMIQWAQLSQTWEICQACSLWDYFINYQVPAIFCKSKSNSFVTLCKFQFFALKIYFIIFIFIHSIRFTSLHRIKSTRNKLWNGGHKLSQFSRCHVKKEFLALSLFLSPSLHFISIINGVVYFSLVCCTLHS
jgi:hypothetical protein